MVITGGISLLFLTAASIYMMAVRQSWTGVILWPICIYGWISWSYFAFMVPQ